VSPAPAAKEKPHLARPVASRRAPVAPPPLPPRRPSEDLLVGDDDEEELDPHALSPKRADALRAQEATPGRSEGRDATMQRARAEAAEARAARAEQQIAERQGLPPPPPLRRGNKKKKFHFINNNKKLLKLPVLNAFRFAFLSCAAAEKASSRTVREYSGSHATPGSSVREALAAEAKQIQEYRELFEV
jgi:hypothetical protein